MKKLIYISVGLILILMNPLTLVAQASEDSPAVERDNPTEQLHQLFEEAWEYGLQQYPFFATQVGVHTYNDKLPDVSIETKKQQLEQEKKFLTRLQSINRETLNAADQLNYDIFEQVRKRQINELEHQAYLIPIMSFLGFHTYFPQLPENMPLQTVEDYQDYISRLNCFHHYSRQHIKVMTTGLNEGYSLPQVVAKDIPAMVEPNIVEDPTESLLYKPFEEFPDRFTESEKKKLSNAGTAAIDTSVVPGFEAFHSFLSDTYIPEARETIAATDMPNGQEYYEHKVRYHTTLNRSPEQIHKTGKQEVKRIRKQMMVIAEQEDYEDFENFVEFLRNDDQFYADTTEELLKETSYILKRLDGQLPKFFNTLARMPYGIKEIPDYQAPQAAGAYYQSPAGDGTRAGFFFINTHDLSSRPLYDMEALALHEAVPGHHLQLALQQELENMPEFRRYARFTAYTEGWALYSEYLGQEMGIYDDPYSKFGRLSGEMHRALRLVVDTGMHAMGWSRQQAIDYMFENSAISEVEIENEVDRYISWPGQALAYKTGELKIRSLRQRAEEELGDQFDLSQFHDVILLNGGLPLPVLDDEVDRYIEEIDSTR